MDPLLAEFDARLRDTVRPSLDGGRVERVGRVVRHVSDAPDGWNGIEWSDLDAASADEVIAEQVAYFSGLGRSFEWKHYGHDRPADLPDRLRAAGFEPDEEEALLVAAVTDVGLGTPAPDGVELRTVTSDTDLTLVRRVHDAVFGDDHTAMVESIRKRMSAGAVAAVLAMAAGEPVCAARVDFHPGTRFASLWGGGTMPEWRGRGVYRATVSHRALLAAERGYTHLRTDALPTSRPILERLGFRRLTTTTPYHYDQRAADQRTRTAMP